MSENDIHEQMHRVREFADERADGVEASPETLKDQTEKMRATASEALEAGRKKAGAAYATSRDTAYRLADRTNRLVQEHPLAIAAGAIAAGAVIAALFPRTRALARSSLAKQAPKIEAAAESVSKHALDAIAHTADAAKRKIVEAASTIDTEKLRAKISEAVETADVEKLKDNAAKMVSKLPSSESVRAHVGELVSKAGEAVGAASKAASDALRRK